VSFHGLSCRVIRFRGAYTDVTCCVVGHALSRCTHTHTHTHRMDHLPGCLLKYIRGFVNTSMKKSTRRRRKHCTLAVVRLSQKFSPRRRPRPWGGGRNGQNLISWRWSLPLPIQTQFGEDRCTQFLVIVVTDPQTQPQTHRQTDKTDCNTLRCSYGAV